MYLFSTYLVQIIFLLIKKVEKGWKKSENHLKNQVFVFKPIFKGYSGIFLFY